MSNGILPLNQETLDLLHQKHPDASPAPEEILLDGEKTPLHHVIFEAIDEEAVKKAVLRTKRGSGPSGMDADNWKIILTSNAFGSTNQDLRKALTDSIKKICTS